jgi:hypothetical protein
VLILRTRLENYILLTSHAKTPTAQWQLDDSLLECRQTKGGEIIAIEAARADPAAAGLATAAKITTNASNRT